MTKREQRIELDAHNRLLALIERALESEGKEVSEYDRDAGTGVFTVDMASTEACYVPFTITVSPLVR